MLNIKEQKLGGLQPARVWSFVTELNNKEWSCWPEQII